MTHLTMAQILQTVDGTADHVTQAAVSSHLAVCPRCRAGLEFQRSLLRASRRMPLPAVSDRFTRSIMARVLPKHQHPAATWTLNNMGSMFAMMAVLGTLWYVLANPGAVAVLSESPQQDGITQQWQKSLEDGYVRLTEALRSLAPRPEQAANSPGPEGMMQKLLLIIASLGLLVLIDRFWLRRLRPRAKG